jgi:PAS domain S-box-containing protein
MGEHSPDSIRILVADNDGDVQEHTGSSLVEAGYTVQSEEGAADILTQVVDFSPHIVLLERSLPGNDGLALCRKIKAMDLPAPIRVILMSGDLTSSEAIADGLEAGADDYLVKPFTARELLARVRRLAGNLECDKRFHATESKNPPMPYSTTEASGEIDTEKAGPLYHALLTSLSSGVVVHAADSSIRMANPAAEKILGLPMEQMRGKRALESNWRFLKEDGTDLEQDHYPVNRVLSTQKALLNEIIGIFRAKTNDIAWVLVNALPVFEESGQIDRVIISFVDITKRKKAETAIHESEQRLRAVFDSVDGVPIQGYDNDLHVILWNPASELLYGYSREEAMGRRLDELIIPEEIRAAVIEANRQWHEDGIPVPKGEIELLHKSGKRLQVYSNHIMIENHLGEKEMFCIDVDMTERRQAEELIQIERHRLASIIEGTNVATWEWNVQTGKCRVNERWAEIIGYTLEEISPVTIETWEEFCHPDDLKLSGDMFEQHFSGHIPYYDCEVRMRHKDGSWVWIHDRGKLISRTEDGQPLMVMGTHTEITERKKSEESLRDSERRLALATASAGIGIWEWNILTDEMIWDDRIFSLYGITEIPEHYGLQYWHNCLHPEDREAIAEACEAALCGEREYDVEFRILWPDGTIRWMQGNGWVVRNESGEPVQMLGTNSDITERKLAERALRESEERHRLIMSNAKDIIYRMRIEDGHYEFVNQAAETITGFDPTIWTERPFLIREMLHPDFHDYFEAEWAEVLKGRIKPSYEYPIIHHRTKEVRWLHQRSVLIRDEAGRPFAVEGVITDITERKQAQIQLEEMYSEMVRAKEEAESANRAKDEFLAVMSHELRTPLNPIIGFSELMLQTASGENAKRLAAIIDAGERMLAQVDHILEFSRLDRATVKPSLKSFNLYHACKGTSEEITSLYDAKHLNSHFYNGNTELLPIATDLEVYSDRLMLVRIMSNLLQNAFKYTDSGSVGLTIGQAAGRDNRINFKFIVEDTGMGIEEGVIPSLFEAFAQADSSYTRPQEGVGLGLAICRKLVDLLEGKIEVSSKLGEGSRFTVTLPLQLAGRAERMDALSDSASPTKLPKALSVLAVEDEESNASVLEMMISGIGGKLTVASNGLEAVDLCAQKDFDVILMDLRMPGIDGFETTSRIREKGQRNAETPIIAVTAIAGKNAEQKCYDSGMSGFITKPIRYKELHRELLRLTC